MKNICFIMILWSFCLSTNATVKVGTSFYDPPYTMNVPQMGVFGFDIDLMKKICSRLKWDCKFIPMKYSMLLTALEENQIDFAMGAIMIFPKKQTQFISSIPYLASEAGFLLKADSPISKLPQLRGKSVGAVRGKGYMDYLQEHFMGQMKIIPYDSLQSLALDLNNGRIDAVFVNFNTALYIQRQFPNKVKVLNEHIQVGDGLGIFSMPVNQDRIDQISQVILQFQSDGTFTSLYDYNFQFFIPQASK
jgi:arginine transport system substrate-binding protein